MKKLILVGAILVVAGISFTSCVKTCSCTEYDEGTVLSTSNQPMVVGVQCADMSTGVTTADGKKDGMFCE